MSLQKLLFTVTFSGIEISHFRTEKNTEFLPFEFEYK